MKEQVKEAEAREQEVIKKKRTAVSNTSLSLRTIPQYYRDHCYVLEDSSGYMCQFALGLRHLMERSADEGLHGHICTLNTFFSCYVCHHTHKPVDLPTGIALFHLYGACCMC